MYPAETFADLRQNDKIYFVDDAKRELVPVYISEIRYGNRGTAFCMDDKSVVLSNQNVSFANTNDGTYFIQKAAAKEKLETLLLFKQKTYKEKLNYSLSLIRRAEKLALQYSDEGYYLGFSGGKDSLVLYHLAKMANVKFHAYMQLSTIDPPEVMHFVRTNYPDVTMLHPPINFYNLIKKERCLPTRLSRFCCRIYKETGGQGRVNLLGIRKEESLKRSKRNEFELDGHKYSGSFDQFNRTTEMSVEACSMGKNKMMLLPILEWTQRDVWQFIHDNRLAYCSLYDEGFDRVGCMFCPMQKKSETVMHRQRYPGVERAIKRSIKYLLENTNFMEKWIDRNDPDKVDRVFDWWISRISFEEYFKPKQRKLF